MYESRNSIRNSMNEGLYIKRNIEKPSMIKVPAFSYQTEQLSRHKNLNRHKSSKYKIQKFREFTTTDKEKLKIKSNNNKSNESRFYTSQYNDLKSKLISRFGGMKSSQVVEDTLDTSVHKIKLRMKQKKRVNEKIAKLTNINNPKCNYENIDHSKKDYLELI